MVRAVADVTVESAHFGREIIIQNTRSRSSAIKRAYD
jgi:hypothetical protein